jgi:hypothetical protein
VYEGLAQLAKLVGDAKYPLRNQLLLEKGVSRWPIEIVVETSVASAVPPLAVTGVGFQLASHVAA